jgi:hypothetical protein
MCICTFHGTEGEQWKVVKIQVTIIKKKGKRKGGILGNRLRRKRKGLGSWQRYENTVTFMSLSTTQKRGLLPVTVI